MIIRYSRLAIFVFTLVMASLLAGWIVSTESDRETEARERLALVATALSDRITIAIDNSTSALYGIGELALVQDGHVDRLPAISRGIRSVHENILNVAIMPEGVVRQMEPIEGNEAAIGHDMFADPDRIVEARLARDTGEMTVTGPYDLVQGGQGVIARLPLYENERFWGFVSIVYAFPDYLDSMGLKELGHQGIRFKLVNTPDWPGEQREVILASDAEPLVDPVIEPVNLPNNGWELQLAYADSFNGILLLKLVGAFLAVVLSVFVFHRTLVAIREQRRLEDTLARKNGEFISRHSDQRRLLARITHDLRSPLQHLLNEARVIARGDMSSRESARSIEQNVRYQLRLIDQLLEHSSRAESEQESFPEPGFLFGFLEEIQQQALLHAKENGNELIVRIDRAVPDVIEADFRALQRILLNLLGNAAKYTREGEVRLLVRVRSSSEGHASLTFRVEDNGEGTGALELAELQQAFRRAGRADGKAGVGLGLYIVSDLLRQMDSQLEYAAGEGGCGSVFHFNLDVRVCEPEAVEAAYIESYVFDWNGEDCRLLIVDDSRPIRDGLAELLMGYGCDVDLHKGDAAALDAARKGRYDLLLCEQRFRGTSLSDLLAANQANLAPARVLVYSSRPLDEQDDADAIDGNCLKPATSSHLLSLVDRLCGRSNNGN
ncbi:CHASE domain-containing protein [Guyparkeria sp.]|uniref:CHASE domain-containing protein n=1 Tax=Guyparkeria sp. TaxID=2035736 RepID=UPI0039710467